MSDMSIAPALGAVGTAAVVRQLRLEARDVISLELVAADGHPLPHWEPGAHIDLTLPNGATRQYSLCGDLSNRSYYRVGVLREQASTGGSEYVHSFLRPGQPVRIGGPRNHFRLDEKSRRYIFLAGGIGITPILAMIGRVARTGAEWMLYYGGRSLASMAFLDELRVYGSRVVAVPEEVEGHLPLAQIIAEPDPNVSVYACGPRAMLDALEKESHQWPADSIHTERFGASGKTVGYTNSVHVLRCARSRKVVTVTAQQTFLQALNDAGLAVPSSCRNGVCGTCEINVLKGTPEHRDDILSGTSREATDRMYPCVSRARAEELTLDL